MSVRAKVLLIISLISLGLILYLVLTSKLISIKGEDDTKTGNNRNIVNQIEKEERKARYEEEMKKIIEGCDNFYEQVEPENSNEDNSKLLNNIAVVREELMELTVPSISEQDRHLKLVLALDSLEEYLETGNESALAESKELFLEVKSKFD